MKQITLDYDTYQAELNSEYRQGVQNGFAMCNTIIEELKAGTTPDSIYSDSSGESYLYRKNIRQLIKAFVPQWTEPNEEE